MPIPPLYGHEGIRHRLVGAIASGRLPQALLFEGPPGVGKQRLALWLAQALVCEGTGDPKGLPDGEPCGKCHPCKLVLNLSHPDVHWFVPLELSTKGGDADKQVELVEEALGEEMAARRQEPLYEPPSLDRKSTRLNSSHLVISYAVFCLKKKKKTHTLD